MDKPALIGLMGYARVGKDTVGDILVERHGYKRRAFADKVRELAFAANPIIGAWPSNILTDVIMLDRYAEEVEIQGYETAKAKYPELRDFLVRLSVGVKAILGPDVWVDATLPPVGDPFFPRFEHYVPHPTVVTDVRYANEAQRILDLGGALWRVSREGVGPANDEERRSFLDIPTPSLLIINDGTLEELEERVQSALNVTTGSSSVGRAHGWGP